MGMNKILIKHYSTIHQTGLQIHQIRLLRAWPLEFICQVLVDSTNCLKCYRNTDVHSLDFLLLENFRRFKFITELFCPLMSIKFIIIKIEILEYICLGLTQALLCMCTSTNHNTAQANIYQAITPGILTLETR